MCHKKSQSRKWLLFRCKLTFSSSMFVVFVGLSAAANHAQTSLKVYIVFFLIYIAIPVLSHSVIFIVVIFHVIKFLSSVLFNKWFHSTSREMTQKFAWIQLTIKVCNQWVKVILCVTEMHSAIELWITQKYEDYIWIIRN